MKYYYFILFRFIFIQPAPAFAQHLQERNTILLQNHKIDSLKRVIANSPDDTVKVMRLLQLSTLYADPVRTSTIYSKKALSIAQAINYKFGIASSIKEIGNVYQNKKDYFTAIRYYQHALDHAEKSTNRLDFYSPLLNLFFYLGDYTKAMHTISSEMILAEKANDKKRIAHAYNILGYIYFKQQNYVEAEKYYQQYINNTRQLNDSVLLAHALGEVADVYINERKFMQSHNVLLNVLQICDQLVNNAGSGYDNQSGTLQQYKAKAYYRLGKMYKYAGVLKNALKYSLKAVEHAGMHPSSKYDIASYHINAGDVFKEMNNFQQAIYHLHYGYRLASLIQHRENIMDAAKHLSEIFALKHNYDSAYYYYIKFTGIKDSILNNETNWKIAGMQTKYDIAKKDKEIARQQQLRDILITSFVFLFIVLILLYKSYSLKQKNIFQQQHNRFQNELFHAIVGTQEQERKRIAEDIHDSVGSVLSAIKLKLSLLEKSRKLLPDDQVEKYDTSLSLLDEASTELRNISHNIMPASLSKLGLVPALQNVTEKICSGSGLQINVITHGFYKRIEETIEISIYRVILELINNIVKHATANKVNLQLIKYPGYINLIVEDNGQGFDYKRVLKEKIGMGLGNVLSRIEYLNGTIEVDSSPGKGTTVVIDIPYS